MVAIKNLIFLALSATAAVLPRATNTVLAGLQKIDADTKSLGDADRAYDGSAASAAPIAAGVVVLQTDLNATAKAAELSVPFSEADAQSIITYITAPLEPDTVSTLNALKANRDKIKQSGFYSTVHQQLVSLKAAVDELSTAIKNKTPSDKKSAAATALGKYQSDWTDAVAYFS